MGKKSVVFVAELSYMEKLEVALKSLCAHKGQWKIYVLNENLPTEWFTLMNRRLEAIDSEILNCRVSAESFKQFSLPSAHIHYATSFRYAIPEFVQENRVLYLDCDMIFTQDLLPLFEVDLNGFGIRAVALAHQKEPNLSFDIYGEGGEQENLQELIDTLGANGYIQLRGHADLREVYPQYELYVTTSQWETFGLTLMEAVGAGLALVGFDARYGNPTFIKDGKNGFLVPYSETMDEDLLVSQMADKIVFALESDLESMHQASYDLAKHYLKPEILEAWRKLLVAIR